MRDLYDLVAAESRGLIFEAEEPPVAPEIAAMHRCSSNLDEMDSITVITKK